VVSVGPGGLYLKRRLLASGVAGLGKTPLLC
jgi:hypothetical protein